MTTPSIAALNTGTDTHLLDHIAPLAALLKIPLLTTEEINFQQTRIYYPHVQAEHHENLEFDLEPIAKNFDALVKCTLWTPHLKTLMQQLHGKKIDLIFCPHGQSDKGYSSPLLAPYVQQDMILVYGHLLISMLQELKIWPAINRFAFIGDYRLAHYKKHKAFYDALADDKIFSHLRPNRPTLLYAPTWHDADESTSFFDQSKTLFAQLPSDWNLIVKVHPLLEQKNPSRYYPILNYLERTANAVLVDVFPPIHPILARVDAYLGDFSSVGYDFLVYQRPMFFFPHSSIPSGRLRSCGYTLDLNTPIFSFMEKHLSPVFASRQEELYRFAFYPQQTENEIRESIIRLLTQEVYSPLKEGRTNTTLKSLRELAVGRASIS